MKTLREITKHFNVPLVENFGSVTTDFQDFLAEAKGEIGKEGYILRFANGHSYKIKTEEYVLLHKAQEALAFEKDVWHIIAAGSADDLKPLLLDEELLAEFVNFEMKYYEEFNKLVKYVVDFVADHKARVNAEINANIFEDVERVRKKAFAQTAIPLVDKFLSSSMFQIYDGKDAYKVLNDLVLRNTTTGTKVDKFRHLMGNLKWDRLNNNE